MKDIRPGDIEVDIIYSVDDDNWFVFLLRKMGAKDISADGWVIEIFSQLAWKGM